MFSTQYVPFLIVSVHPLKREKNDKLLISGYWVIGADC